MPRSTQLTLQVWMTVYFGLVNVKVLLVLRQLAPIFGCFPFKLPFVSSPLVIRFLTFFNGFCEGIPMYTGRNEKLRKKYIKRMATLYYTRNCPRNLTKFSGLNVSSLASTFIGALMGAPAYWRTPGLAVMMRRSNSWHSLSISSCCKWFNRR